MFTWRKEFGLLPLGVPKLPRKKITFLLLLLCGDLESCPGPQVQENLPDISKLRGIKLIHQNLRDLLSKEDISETLFTTKNLSQLC